MTDSIIETEQPLRLHYLPERVVDRADERSQLRDAFADSTAHFDNYHVHGPRGSGKTHLVQLALTDCSEHVTRCFVPCAKHDTEYKVLQQLYMALTGEQISDGHHKSQLHREVENHLRTSPMVLILDEIEFLLQNDGDTLLYSLSRIEHDGNLGIVTISSHHVDLESKLEERTYSSLLPQRIGFEAYSADVLYRILAERAKDALTGRSVKQQSLTFIASSTQNAGIGITWLRVAAKTADGYITEPAVKDCAKAGYEAYVERSMRFFSDHHDRLYGVIRDLAGFDGETTSGDVYERYEQACESDGVDPLSTRRISDFLKQLELLNLIDAEYHYGGEEGKTRSISLRPFF